MLFVTKFVIKSQWTCIFENKIEKKINEIFFKKILKRNSRNVKKIKEIKKKFYKLSLVKVTQLLNPPKNQISNWVTIDKKHVYQQK